jgi:hypothetical protein
MLLLLSMRTPARSASCNCLPRLVSSFRALGLRMYTRMDATVDWDPKACKKTRYPALMFTVLPMILSSLYACPVVLHESGLYAP